MDRTSAVAAAYGAVAAGDSDESVYGYGQPRSLVGWDGSSDEDSDDEFKAPILDNPYLDSLFLDHETGKLVSYPQPQTIGECMLRFWFPFTYFLQTPPYLWFRMSITKPMRGLDPNSITTHTSMPVVTLWLNFQLELLARPSRDFKSDHLKRGGLTMRSRPKQLLAQAIHRSVVHYFVEFRLKFKSSQAPPLARRLPTVQELDHLAAKFNTPKSDSFEDVFNGFAAEEREPERRRRSKGFPKPHHIARYTPLTKMFLRDGKDHYRQKILFENAFPSGDDRAKNGRAAWDAAVLRNVEAYNNGMSNCNTCVVPILTIPAASTKVFNNNILRMVSLVRCDINLAHGTAVW
jgi:hypothetical protein